MKRTILPATLAGILLIVSGCKDDAKTLPPAATSGAATDDAGEDAAGEEGHSHGSGPHGGAVADWGGGAYHVEFTVDHDAQETSVYILGSDGKSPAPIEASAITLNINEPATEIELQARPLEGEAEGTSSRFVGKHETIGIVREFAGTISGEVDGTPYLGEFVEVAGEN